MCRCFCPRDQHGQFSDQLTKDQIEAEESDGFVSFTFTSPISEGGTLLMDSLVLGLTEIEHSYSKRYLKVKVREV